MGYSRELLSRVLLRDCESSVCHLLWRMIMRFFNPDHGHGDVNAQVTREGYDYHICMAPSK